MLGNAKDAEFIHNWYHEVPYGQAGAPEGWKYLGSGSFRSAYLSPDGVVYKVQKDIGPWCGYQTNEGEWETWKRLYLGCKMPKHSRLPKLTYFPISEKVGVIAIERLKGKYTYYGQFKDEAGVPRYWSDVCDAIRTTTKLGDLHGNNLMIDEERNLLVPTDLGDSSNW